MMQPSVEFWPMAGDDRSMKRILWSLLFVGVLGACLVGWSFLDHSQRYIGLPAAGEIANGAASEPPVEVFVTPNGKTAIATLTGPPSLLERIRRVEKARRDCVLGPGFIPQWFAIDWGDDERIKTHQAAPILAPDGCEDWSKHTYSANGKYRIRATIGHLGETDIPMPDWLSEVTIEVRNIPATGFDLTLGGSAEGGTFLYGEPIPVEWDLVTEQPVQLVLALVDESGRKLTQKTSPA
jgi:hypothetical protein